MESMRPDRDELDQFKHRQSKSKVTAKDGLREKEAVRSNKIAKKVVKNKADERTSSPFVLLLLIVLLATCGGLSWMVYQQQAAVMTLKQDLEDASGFIGQSKLLMARFEGELSTTGAELEQSGSAAEKKLAFLDSEMRKLWVISNERNKKTIYSNKMILKSLSLKQEEITDRQNKLLAEEKVQQSDIKKSLAKLESDASKKINSLNHQVSSMASEVVILRVEQEDAVAGVQSLLSGFQKIAEQQQSDLEKVAPRIIQVEQSIESINASRRQINERLVDLERQFNQLMSLNLNKRGQNKQQK